LLAVTTQDPPTKEDVRNLAEQTQGILAEQTQRILAEQTQVSEEHGNARRKAAIRVPPECIP
jgi:hypothetical protein